MVRKLIFRSLALAVVVSVLAGGITPGQGGNPPQITFVSFPPEIKADGNPVGGFVGFKDPDGDIAKAEFTVVQATDFQPFSFDPNVKGAKEGVFEFTLATKVPQRVTLRLTLVDEAGNRSQPKDFSFEAVAPILQVTPTSLSFSEQVGRTPPSQTIQITNAGRGTISWTASADQPWISLTPTSGVAPATVTVSLNTTGLAVGSYSGRIVVEAPGVHGSPAIVTVSLTLMPVPPAMLEVSPEKLEFRGRQGAGNPEPKTLTIRNIGGQPLTWTAQANVPWLTISRSSGALQAGERAELQVSANIAGLSAGTLTAQITITAPEARNSPVIVPVALTIEAMPPGVLEVTPTQLEFRGQEGGSNPAAQTLTVRNSGGQALTWTAQLSVPWIRLSHSSGTLQAGGSTQLTVSVDISGLSANTYLGQITISSPGARNSPVTVVVKLTLSPQPAILITAGHREWLTPMETLLNDLRARDYTIYTTEQKITPNLLRRRPYKVLLIQAPWGDFQPEEIQAIIDFVREGGGLFITGLGWSYVQYEKKPLEEAPFNKIATHFGIFFDHGIICDPTDHLPESECTPIFKNITPHPVTRGVTAVTCKGCNPGPIKASAGTILIKGDEDAYCTYGAPPCSLPPFMVAVEFGQGRVIALGHNGTIDDRSINLESNRILALNIFDWLAKR